MFGNCSELSALVFITGPSEKCLKSFAAETTLEMFDTPMYEVRYRFTFNSINKFENQINKRIKERWSNYCVNICEHAQMS